MINKKYFFMKKLLLGCFLALGIGASAQYSYVGNFEDPGYNTTIYKQFGGGTRTTAAACNGTYGGQLAISSSVTQTGYMVDLSTIGQTGNGQKIDVSANYKKAATITGNISLAYFVLDPVSNSWSINTFGPTVALTSAAITTCTPLTGTIPSGAIQPGQVYGVGVWFVRSGTTTGNIYVDDISVNQEVVSTPPACTTLSYPAGGATVSAGNVNLTWAAAPTAVNYKVEIGTTSGGSDIFNSTVAGNSLNVTLPKSTTFYVKITPSNLSGDASGCTEVSFSTNSTIGYCGGITASAAVYPISSVTLNGVTNTSPAATGSPVYEDFTGTSFNVLRGLSYPINVIGTGAGTNRFGMTVFIDWNQDGDFSDAGEQYFTTSPFVGGAAATNNLTGTIVVPDNALTGATRMRVKYNFNSSATSIISALSDPCGNMGNGQVEDYTINVTVPTAAPGCTTITAPVAGATDFPLNGNMTWNAEPSAAGYKLYIGTTPGGTDVVNGVVVNGTSYKVSLTANVVYYARVIPYNIVGDATGCTEISFTATGPVYCGPLSYSTVEPTTRVEFAGIVNSGQPSGVGATPAHEFFLDKTAQVTTGSPYTITLDANTDGASFRHFFAVFIDWNQDGDFDEANEKYFTTPETFINVLGSNGASANPATGTIAVPGDAKPGLTRMRVKSAFYSAAGPSTEPNLSNFANGCVTTGSSFGQVEDYSVFVTASTAGTSNVDKNKVTVYPNPFKDVLKISDVSNLKSVSISDVTGRLVRTLKASAEINLSDLNAGMYLIILHKNDGSTQTVKAIKK